MRTDYSSWIEDWDTLGTYRLMYENWLDENIKDEKLKDFLWEEENVSSELFIIDTWTDYDLQEMILKALKGEYRHETY